MNVVSSASRPLSTRHRIRREPLTRCQPDGAEVSGCRFFDPRGVLDPSGSADPGRGKVEECVPVFRISRRLGSADDADSMEPLASWSAALAAR